MYFVIVILATILTSTAVPTDNPKTPPCEDKNNIMSLSEPLESILIIPSGPADGAFQSCTDSIWQAPSPIACTSQKLIATAYSDSQGNNEVTVDNMIIYVDKQILPYSINSSVVKGTYSGDHRIAPGASLQVCADAQTSSTIWVRLQMIDNPTPGT